MPIEPDGAADATGPQEVRDIPVPGRRGKTG